MTHLLRDYSIGLYRVSRGEWSERATEDEAMTSCKMGENPIIRLHMTYIILFITILAIVGSALWSPGSIILLDYVLTPHAAINWSEPVIFPILNSLSGLLGTEIVSKGFFIMILIVGAYLGVLMARWVGDRFGYIRYRSILGVFGGIFMLINPYIYERMMVQPTIALGTFLLGYVIYFLFFAHRIVVAGVFAGLAFIVMPHASYMIVLIFALYVIFSVRSWRSVGYVVLAGLIVLVMNANWILAPYFGYTNSVASISSFSSANLDAFRTQSIDPLDIFSTNILLYGFWGERYGNHYVNVGFLSSLWYIAGFFLLLVVAIGYMQLWKYSRKLSLSLLIVGFVSLILGIGIASPMTVPLMNWGYEYLPLFSGYREPQKWIGLLMLVEGIGLIVGLGYFLQKSGKDRILRVSIIVILSLLLLTWSPGPLLGYHGQLRTTVYPVSFADLRSEILPSFSGRILALPWHSYIGCSWIGRPTVSNPIMGLLAPLPVVSSDNIEVSDILYSNSQTPQTGDIEQFLKNGDISLLQNHRFTHIFLMRGCASSTDMETLLRTIEQSGSLILQRSENDYMLYQIPSSSYPR
ncbi:hypothetical protein H7169_01320 [Candidatus Gracilibacteria bacterium]|nr:hypothetical protein [Candidatus Gracilibacteria bacterium]